MQRFEDDIDSVVAETNDMATLAVDMLALAERAYSRRDFIDTAYSVPYYLKDFQATKPKPLL